MAKSVFLTRTITATGFAAVLITAILWSPFSSALLFLIATVMGTTEWYRLNGSGHRQSMVTGYMGAAAIYLAIVLTNYGEIELRETAILVLLLPALFITELLRRKRKVGPNTAMVIGGWLYVALPFALVSSLSMIQDVFEPKLVLGYFFLLWASDTGAYLSGSRFGKTKLAPDISPGKTWEGLAGGLALTLLIAWVNFNFIGIIDLSDWMAVALITVSCGTLGDLAESAMKRDSGVKDSGRMLPGHGGVLDRFDSLLISLPVVFVYLYFRLL